MKSNHDVRGLLSSLAEAQAMATALGLGFIAFLIGMAILETCNTAEGDDDGVVDARVSSARR